MSPHQEPFPNFRPATSLSAPLPPFCRPVPLSTTTHAGCTAFSAFGVFDGHGGKSVATYASKSLLPLVASYADRCKGSEPLPPDAEAMPMDVGEEQRCCMAAQDALVERLPRVRMPEGKGGGGEGTVRMPGEEGVGCTSGWNPPPLSRKLQYLRTSLEHSSLSKRAIFQQGMYLLHGPQYVAYLQVSGGLPLFACLHFHTLCSLH